MHIVAIFMSVLGAAAVFYWRFRMLREAGRDAVDLVARARGAHRMRKFRKHAEGSVLTAIDDPGLAAAVFLFALAGERPVGTQPATSLIRAELADAIAAERMDETIAYAEWAARSVADPRDCIRRFGSLWRETLSLEQRDELLGMAANIAGPSPEPHQQITLDALRSTMTFT